MIDLDGFKGVNDRHGHAAGDDVLREVAARIARSIRTGDTAARLGGDEFAVLLTGVSGPELVDGTSERVRTAVDAPWIVAGAAVDLCASVGQAVTTPQSTTPAELLRRADAAMYHDKRTRRAAAAASEDREARPNGRGRPGRSAVHATAGG
jgi:diguanylate cyclase (GGDEF)-like protein